MTDHAHQSLDDLRASDARQARLLDAYLDDLRSGNTPPPPRLNPDLSQIARLAHELDATPLPSMTQRAAKARTWEKLMHPSKTASILAFASLDQPDHSVSYGPAARSSQRLVGSPGAVGSEAATSPRVSSRLHRIGGRSLGLVATLTLVALVALSAFAVYLSAPPRNPLPTIMLAGVGEGTPGSPQPDGVLLPNRTTCTVAPRDYDQIISLLEPYRSGRSELPTPWLVAPRNPGEAVLPTGPAPDATATSKIAALWGMYQGCQLSREYRRSASLFTDDGIVRYYLVPGSAIDHVVDLLSYEPVADDALPQLDEPSSRAMTDLRLIGDDRAAAFISTGWTNPATPPLANDIRRQFGHIFFVRQGDRWLIDELTWW